ncbi:MAG: hypothetical protein ABIH23_03125 [bacterium]
MARLLPDVFLLLDKNVRTRFFPVKPQLVDLIPEHTGIAERQCNPGTAERKDLRIISVLPQVPAYSTKLRRYEEREQLLNSCIEMMSRFVYGQLSHFITRISKGIEWAVFVECKKNCRDSFA